jgi:Kelch motif/Galactose oxidase, central domain
MPYPKTFAFLIPSIKPKKVFFAIIFTIISLNCFSQNQWTWMSGYLVSDAVWLSPRPSPTPLSERGNSWVLNSRYKPSVREHPAGGIVNNNEIYMYGGAALDNDFASDFWVYDISQQKWAFIYDLGWPAITDIIGRESTIAQLGGRNRVASAVDNNGNIWFFGGLYKNRNTDEISSRSDLWKYNTKTKKFTYFGDQGSSPNKPSMRHRARAWFDDSNNLWIYGGVLHSTGASYNDLWKYNTTTNEWAFVSGDKNISYCKTCINGVYPSPTDTLGTQYYPRARSDYGYWKDNSGSVWIYGGYTEDHGVDEYGDLWKFNPTTSQWTLISGSDVFNPPATATNPGSRNAPYCWVGSNGKLYMTGGSRQYFYFLRDTWRVNPTDGSWEAVNTDSTLINNVPVSAGFQIEDSTNIPGASVNTLDHLTTGSHTYLFSGYGMGSNNNLGFTGAMWRYSLDGYDQNLLPIANADTITLAYRDSIYCDIKANDLPKTGFKNTTFDIDINLAGIQNTLTTTNGIFSIDSSGVLLFRPRPWFEGIVTLKYTYQNNAKYISNTAQLRLLIYHCSSDFIYNLTSPNDDIHYGIHQYVNNEIITMSNKIEPHNNDRVSIEVNSPKSILLQPGLVITPNNGSTFEAKINGGCN